MKTKTIFKTLALAMLMPAMLLTTACSSSNDDAIINNENINNENTAKKGFTIPVTVNVTRQGDATTRATYNEGDKKLEFSAGDKLFVWDFGYSSAGYFAGTLNYVENSGGTFSGTIITQNEYSGTAETLLSQSDPNAVLLPNGYGTYGFLSIKGDGYRSTYEYDYTKAFADSKAAAVAQFSYEYAEGYSSGFALTPKSAILNFTITGLTASTSVNVVFTKGNLNIDKTVTTNESGTATFAIGVEDYSDLKDCTLTVGGNIISLVSSSKKLYAGSIYNITRSAAPAPTYTMAANATAEDYGKVVCNNGHLHPAKTAVPSGCTAVGILGKVTTETGHGLILALEDATNQTWNTINGWTSVTTYASTTLKLLPDADARGSLTSYTTLGSITVSNWAVAQKSDYSAIFQNLGSTKSNNGYTFDANVNAYIITNVGGTAMTTPSTSPHYYWSATEYNSTNGWVFYDDKWGANGKGGTEKVRPVLAF